MTYQVSPSPIVAHMYTCSNTRRGHLSSHSRFLQANHRRGHSPCQARRCRMPYAVIRLVFSPAGGVIVWSVCCPADGSMIPSLRSWHFLQNSRRRSPMWPSSTGWTNRRPIPITRVRLPMRCHLPLARLPLNPLPFVRMPNTMQGLLCQTSTRVASPSRRRQLPIHCRPRKCVPAVVVCL